MKNTVVQGMKQNNRKELITAVAARYKCFSFLLAVTKHTKNSFSTYTMSGQKSYKLFLLKNDEKFYLIYLTKLTTESLSFILLQWNTEKRGKF